MARPLRVEYAGALYHVMNRGNQKINVFKKQRDCKLFLEKLEYFSELFEIEIYCYVIMNNHFHLLLKTKQANLGRFMQSFLTSFTITMNRLNKSSGHLFQGRYKAQLVEEESYFSKVSRYIHLNPVRIKKLKTASIKEKQEVLMTYRWSTYPFYSGINKPPTFIKIESVLKRWGEKLESQIKNYKSYVEEGLYRDVTNPFELANRQMIIGSESFSKKILSENIIKQVVRDNREQRKLVNFQHSFSLDLVISTTANYFNISNESVMKRKSIDKIARKSAIFLACKYCIAHTSLTDIGKQFGISVSGITNTRNKMNKILLEDMFLKEQITEIEKCIVKV